MASRILVLGGSGFVGRSLCARLAGAARLTVATRDPVRAAHLRELATVRIVGADPHEDRQLDALLAGQEAVVNLIAILHGNAVDFERVHVRLPRCLAEACRRAGVHRVVHVSALGVDPAAPSLYLRSKARGEQALAEAGLQLTVLRPSVIFGEHDRFLNLFAKLLAVFPVLPLAGASSRYQPVWVEDVAAAITECLHSGATIGQTIECAGTRVYTLKELVERTGEWSGHRRAVIPLAGPLGRLQALVMEYLPGTPLLSRDNLDSMRVPSVASGRLPGLASLGITPASLEEIAPGYLARRR